MMFVACFIVGDKITRRLLTFKALGQLLWLWRGLKSCKKVMWGRVIQTDLVTWSFKVWGHNLRPLSKKDRGIVMRGFAARSAAIFPLSTKKPPGGVDIRTLVGACFFFFCKFCPNLLNRGIDEDRALAKQSLLHWPCPLPSHRAIPVLWQDLETESNV